MAIPLIFILFFILTWPFRIFLLEHYYHRQYIEEFKSKQKEIDKVWINYNTIHHELMDESMFWDQIPLTQNALEIFKTKFTDLSLLQSYDYLDPKEETLKIDESSLMEVFQNYMKKTNQFNNSEKKAQIHHVIKLIYSSQRYDLQLIAINLWIRASELKMSDLLLENLKKLKSIFESSRFWLDLRLNKNQWDEILISRIGFCSRINEKIQEWGAIRYFFQEWIEPLSQIDMAIAKSKTICYPNKNLEKYYNNEPYSLSGPIKHISFWQYFIKNHSLEAIVDLEAGERRLMGYLYLIGSETYPISSNDLTNN